MNKANLYTWHFLLLKLFYGVSALLILVGAVSSFDVFTMVVSSLGLIILGAQFWGLLKAEKLLQDKNLFGYYIVLGLTLLILPSMAFPLSIFGLYSLLHPDFRRAHLGEVPEVLHGLFQKVDALIFRPSGETLQN
jgi:hypothetical protein